MDWKRIIKITAGLLIIAGISAGAYYYFRNNIAAQNIINLVLPGSAEKPAGTNQASDKKLRILVDSEIFDYWLSKTQGLFYMTPAGEIMKRNFEGQDEVFSSQEVPKIRRISASPDGNSIIAEFNHPASDTFAIFNTSTRNWKLLPTGTISAAWSPDGQEIALADGSALRIFDLKTGKTRELSKFSQQDTELFWPTTQRILISQSPSITEKSSLWVFDTVKKTMLPLIEDANGLTIRWSDDRTLGIRLSSVDEKPYTRLINSNGETLATFIFTTLPSKCLINGNQIYCAVPENLKDGLKLPDDYLKRAAYFNDRIYLIDMAASQTQVIFEDLEQNIDADHLEFLQDSITFKNRVDGKLYSLALPAK